MGRVCRPLAVLESAMAITNAIGSLIRAATLSQQEIVAKGRGTASSAQFYKKNNRWTEGSASAAMRHLPPPSGRVARFDTGLRPERGGGARLPRACGAPGLITAAKSVASATTSLVEAADGVVNGTHTMEQLVVAAHEVCMLGGGTRWRATVFSGPHPHARRRASVHSLFNTRADQGGWEGPRRWPPLQHNSCRRRVSKARRGTQGLYRRRSTR